LRSSSPRTAISAEDAIERVEVDYEPLPAIADFLQAPTSGIAVHEAFPDNIAGGMAGLPPDEDTFASAACVAKVHVYQQMYVPVPIECRGWSSNGTRRPRN
jgi:carbon-monoxide dehydrogenase large subunit